MIWQVVGFVLAIDMQQQLTALQAHFNESYGLLGRVHDAITTGFTKVMQQNTDNQAK